MAALTLSALVCAGMAIGVASRVARQAQLANAYDRTQTAAHASAGLLSLTQEYAFYREPRAAQQWRTDHALIQSALADSAALAHFESKNLTSLRETLAELPALFSALEEASGENQTPLAHQRKQMIVDQLITNTQSVADQAYQLSYAVNEQSSLTIFHYLQFFSAVAVIFALVICQFAYLIFRRILRPLSILGDTATGVRLGDLTVRTGSQVNDELGDVAREFDAMTAALAARDMRVVQANEALVREVALRTETEKRILLITDNLPVMVAYVGADGRYGFANQQYREILGYDHTSMVGRLVREVIGDANFARIEKSAQSALDGKPVSFEVRLDSSKNSREFRATYTPDNDASGNVLGFFVMHEDITDRKIASETMRALNSRFELATHAGGIAVWEWDIGTDLLEADSRMYALYQMEMGSGKQQFSAWADRLHPEDRARVEQEIAATIDGTRGYDTEFRVVWPNGEIRTVKANGILTRNQNDQPIMVGINWDISELRRAERAQRYSEERFRLLVDGVADYAVVMLDAHGFVEGWNAAAQHMLAYETEEIIGHSHSLFFPDEAIARRLPQTLLDDAYATGSRRDEGWRVKKNGALFFADVAITALRDDSGALRGYGTLVRDLTVQRERERVISAALDEKETLLKEVYHRVKNNLQVITSLLKLQARALGAGEAQNALTGSIGRVRAMSLVHEKLYQSGTLASIALNDYIGDLCRQLSVTTGAIDHGIDIICDAEPLEIRLEVAVPLGLLLNELVTNCLKHAFPEGRRGKVTIRLRSEPSGIVLVSVIDDGIGIDAQHDIQSSSSLGLKLATTLCSQLDAQLEIVSDSGTTIHIRFAVPTGSPLR